MLGPSDIRYPNLRVLRIGASDLDYLTADYFKVSFMRSLMLQT